MWLTEWACQDYGSPNGKICDQAGVEAFQKTAIDWFRGEGASMVQRWAWFGLQPGANSNQVTAADGSANAVGKSYVSQ